ncbi:MAG: ATP-binding protein [Collinsella sp.]
MRAGNTKQYRESIFQPFFRLDKSRSRAYGGAGLGLALVWEIAALHGGTVEVEASSENRTVMLVTLSRGHHVIRLSRVPLGIVKRVPKPGHEKWEQFASMPRTRSPGGDSGCAEKLGDANKTPRLEHGDECVYQSHRILRGGCQDIDPIG